MDADLGDEIIEISDTESIEEAPHKLGHKRKRTRSSSYSDSSSSSEGVVWLDEDSESELEVECEYWDQDCVVLNKLASKSTLHGFHLMPTCSLEPADATIINHVPELNTRLQNTNTIMNIQTNWENHNKLDEAGVEIITEPWRAFVISDFLQDSSLLNDVRQDYNEVSWHRRTLDLYEFFQSDDLEKVNLQNIRKMYDFICGDLKSWVATITGLELSEVSATCSFYSETDFLLVHDDQRGNRAVAFVIYMTGDDGWQPEWGGALQLLSRDDTGQPSSRIVRNIYPQNNQLVLFPVTDRSFHQVLEVTTASSHPRLSINGWFHTPTSTIFDSPVNSPATIGGLRSAQHTRPQYSLTIELKDWIMPPYLELRTAMQVQQYMEDSSEICLDGYVEKTAFSEVWRQISRHDLKWEHQGPLNRRNYSTLVEESLPDKLVDFINVFKSGEYFKLLQEYTAVDFNYMRYEVQRWQQGNYDLLGGRPESMKGMRLDVILFLCHDYDEQNDQKNNGSLKHHKTSNKEIEAAINSINEAIPNEDNKFLENTKNCAIQDDITNSERLKQSLKTSQNIDPDSTITSNDIDNKCKIDNTGDTKSNEIKNSAESINTSTSDIDMSEPVAKCQITTDISQDDADMLKHNAENDKSLLDDAKDICPSTSTNDNANAKSDISNDNVDSSSCHLPAESMKQNQPMPHDIIGGKLMYVDIKEKIQNALVTITPNNNTINFVYGDTAYFTSYLSKKNPKDAYFYVVFASYYEEQRNEAEFENQNLSGDSE